jgi:hypothetical protein
MPEAVRGRLIRRRVVTGFAVVVVAASVIGAAAYRLTYGTFAFWGEPPRISWCGRDYLLNSGTVLTRVAVEQQRAALPGDQPYPVVQVAKFPPLIGEPVLASVTPKATRDRLGIPCAMILYLQTGADSYRPYVLSGGP